MLGLSMGCGRLLHACMQEGAVNRTFASLQSTIHIALFHKFLCAQVLCTGLRVQYYGQDESSEAIVPVLEKGLPCPGRSLRAGAVLLYCWLVFGRGGLVDHVGVQGSFRNI